MRFGQCLAVILSLLLALSLGMTVFAQVEEGEAAAAAQSEAVQEAGPAPETGAGEEAVAAAEAATEDGEDERSEEAQDAQAAAIQSAVESARSAARQALESIPDPSQIVTQASSESISQGQPTLEEQVVYSVSPWTGKQYAGTFAPRQVDTFYLIADEYSIVNVQKTMVYFWPITGEYMADWFGLREEVPGRLEILKDGRVVETLERTQYSYYYPSGLANEQKLYIGEEAVRVYEDYQARLDAYYDAVSAYYNAQREWQRQMDEILREVQATGQYKDPSEIPEPPVQPTPPTDFAYSPRTAFIVKLPVGRYQVRLRGENGEIVEGTAKTLEVFDARRRGIGYNVIPEHKWTRSFQSNDPSEIFYLDGRRVFYVMPHYAREYNRYQYIKMSNLHKPLEGEGTRGAWSWAQFEPVSGAKLQVLQGGEVIREIDLKPYYVRQTAGYALGYNIVEFDPEADPTLRGRSPTFEAYRVELEGGSSYQLRFVDEHGNVLIGGVREVRPVKPVTWNVYAIPFLPFVVGLVVFGWRRTKAAKKGSVVEA